MCSRLLLLLGGATVKFRSLNRCAYVYLPWSGMSRSCVPRALSIRHGAAYAHVKWSTMSEMSIFSCKLRLTHCIRRERLMRVGLFLTRRMLTCKRFNSLCDRTHIVNGGTALLQAYHPGFSETTSDGNSAKGVQPTRHHTDRVYSQNCTQLSLNTAPFTHNLHCSPCVL